MNTPMVVTYDNAPTEITHFFLKTMESQKWTCALIGEGEQWLGFRSKLVGYKQFLNTLPDEKLVVLSDARDVVCVRSPTAFYEGFSSFQKDIVVSMELLCCGKFDVDESFKGSQCIPLTQYWKHHGIAKLPDRKFVNSGLIAGRAIHLRHFLGWALDNLFKDDQFALGCYMNTFPERVAADYDALLLHTTTFGVNAAIQSIHIQKHDSPTFAEFFGRGAFFLHIAGLGGKGQIVIYKYVKLMIDEGARCSLLSDAYKYKEPQWNEKF